MVTLSYVSSTCIEQKTLVEMGVTFENHYANW